MSFRWTRRALFSLVMITCGYWTSPGSACCPAGPLGQAILNADQTVVILWDAANKTQHFIRKANFLSEADDFGFLIPSPSQPELEESGNEAFPHLQKLTEPEIQYVSQQANVGCACNQQPQRKLAVGRAELPNSVKVLQQKEVAGFQAAVLEAKSATALVEWLKTNGYAFSPEVEAWAKPYVAENWKITALKVAKPKDASQKKDKAVAASALRLSFQTDRPLFPYREPDPKTYAKDLNAKQRLLRIYFLAEAKYQGELTKEVPWTGTIAWANKISSEDRRTTLKELRLPETTGPEEMVLTEFEDRWPYRLAPADVYFSPHPDQESVKRPPIIRYVSSGWPKDLMACSLGAALLFGLFRIVGRDRTKHAQATAKQLQSI